MSDNTNLSSTESLFPNSFCTAGLSWSGRQETIAAIVMIISLHKGVFNTENKVCSASWGPGFPNVLYRGRLRLRQLLGWLSRPAQ